MSWDAYRDNLVSTNHVSQAAIIGLDDGNPWTMSPGLNITQEQGRALISGFCNASALQSNGFSLGNVKYMYIQSDDSQLQGKKGTTGVSICKTNRCLVIGVYHDGIQPGNCRAAVEKLSDYLRQSTY